MEGAAAAVLKAGNGGCVAQVRWIDLRGRSASTHPGRWCSCRVWGKWTGVRPAGRVRRQSVPGGQSAGARRRESARDFEELHRLRAAGNKQAVAPRAVTGL